ncbi:MAG TPA: mechanosensitive ion channel family protein [Rhodanobacteraceae bacterium]|jgi:miniconductance mechanosensitive channel|nr:mechanosensitive ion channel family protein [Rhodanobacteraceae bacterium]
MALPMAYLDRLLTHPWVHTLLGCVALLLLAWLCSWLARHVLVRVARSISTRTRWRWDDAMIQRGVALRLAQVVPMLVIQWGIPLVPGVPAKVEAAVASITTAMIVVFAVLAVSGALSAVEDIYSQSPRGREHSIKGYVQLLKIVVFAVAVILFIAALFDRSPLALLAGLGAISAVLLLIFKDTILSLVASVQIATNDMLRIGDWIALPDDNVDGDVIEIALNTVKVRNWDKTVSTVPTWHLMSKSYRNYRFMYATGRRIRRALNIDLTTVRFLKDDEIAHLRQFQLLQDYFQRKQEELANWNRDLGTAGEIPVNRRRLSNLGTFRAYMQAYVAAAPTVNHDLFWAVRQLDPGPDGIPLQVYGYTVDTGFVAHANATDDIFDHLIAIAPEFGLKVFQQPSGDDVRTALADVRHERSSVALADAHGSHGQS